MEVEDYRGVDVLMAYGPVDLDSLRWGVIAKIDRSEAMAPLTAYTRRALAAGGALALLASVVGAVHGHGADAADRRARRRGAAGQQGDPGRAGRRRARRRVPRAGRGLQRDGPQPPRQPRGSRSPGGGERAAAAEPAAGVGRRPGQGRHLRDTAVVRRRDRRAHQSRRLRRPGARDSARTARWGC